MGDADFDCPACDRDTLTVTPENVTSYQCAVCGELVLESGVPA